MTTAGIRRYFILRLELRALSQQFARDLLELFAITLLGVALAKPSPVDIANVGFAWISAELGAGRKMLDLIWTDSELFSMACRCVRVCRLVRLQRLHPSC